MNNIIDYPSLKTFLMVERMLKNAEIVMTKEELKAKTSKKITYKTLNIILDYFKKQGKIMEGHRGILWIYNSSPKLKKAIERGKEI
ncbi:hypothetical protein J4422_02895 [Candidatus Pacearchaeota archaeon]|nr:hypothetical protein [Candidatus Pacearchaeota archaeon]